MTKRTRTRVSTTSGIAEPAAESVPPPDVPGPEADASTLRSYAIGINDRRACMAYNQVVILCYWCLADDQQVRARGASKQEGNKYCTDRCADAAEAYRTKVLCGGRASAPAAEDEA